MEGNLDLDERLTKVPLIDVERRLATFSDVWTFDAGLNVTMKSDSYCLEIEKTNPTSIFGSW